MHEISINAPAKINLHLAVTNKRDDGFHDIETVMMKISLYDRLHLKLTDAGLRISCTGGDVPHDESNLACKAAAAFLASTDISQGVEIKLEKNIPVAAGLGGGSSDAAAVLHGLNKLHGNPLSTEELIEIARLIGSDIPFCVSEFDLAFGSGKGDRLTELKIADKFWVVLVNPGFSVSTKWVYENFALTSRGNPYILGRTFENGNALKKIDKDEIFNFFNDLEAVTLKRYPEIKRIKEDFVQAGAFSAQMTGSGPTVYGLFTNEGNASNCYAFFKKCYEKSFVALPLAFV